VFNVQEMLHREITFHEIFTRKIVKEYGIIFYNPLNPLSYDSNHAHILEISGDLKTITRDIIGFYNDFGITPRIYPAFIDGELEKLRPVLEYYGFRTTVHNNTFLLLQSAHSREFVPNSTVRRIRKISKNILDLAYSGSDEDWGEWQVKVFREAVKSRNYHLLGLFHSGKCMSLASVHIMDGYSRVDDVKTHAEFRRNHFGTQLMDYLVEYHRQISDNYLYLWADNPIAIRMYMNAGFRDVKVDIPRWSAFIPPAVPASP
jgi:ribosomal protein S18 acetylase RimI-like enzyme